MRRELKPILYDCFSKDKKLWLITADLGYGFLDDIKKDFSDRFINISACEQLMLGIGTGLALEGRIPICYTITSFFWRAAEWIRNYLNHEKIPVKLLGSGHGNDYESDGFTHFAGDDKDLMNCFPNIKCYWPKTTKEMINILPDFLYNNKPSYLNLKR